MSFVAVTKPRKIPLEIPYMKVCQGPDPDKRQTRISDHAVFPILSKWENAHRVTGEMEDRFLG